MATEQDKRTQIDNGIEDTFDQEQVLRGLQPKHQFAYKLYRYSKVYGIVALAIAGMLFGLTFVEAISKITTNAFYRKAIVLIIILGVILIGFAVLLHLLFLKKPPFDRNLVKDVLAKKLSADIIFYDKHYLYPHFDVNLKETDRKEAIAVMNDLSPNFSYFIKQVDNVEGYMQIECKKRMPIPTRAAFKESDDPLWNVVPLGLTINNTTQSISAIGWYLNDNQTDPNLYKTIPSTSILIAGGTGCFIENQPILMYNTLVN